MFSSMIGCARGSSEASRNVPREKHSLTHTPIMPKFAVGARVCRANPSPRRFIATMSMSPGPAFASPEL